MTRRHPWLAGRARRWRQLRRRLRAEQTERDERGRPARLRYRRLSLIQKQRLHRRIHAPRIEVTRCPVCWVETPERDLAQHQAERCAGERVVPRRPPMP